MEPYCTYSEYFDYKPPKFFSIITTPLHKSIDTLKIDFKREKEFDKKVDQWLTEENIIPKM